MPSEIRTAAPKKFADLRIQRNCKSGFCFVAERRDCLALPINVAQAECGRFGLAESRQPDELDKICALLGIRIKLLRADAGNDRLELFKGRSFPDRFVELDRTQMINRRATDRIVARGYRKKVLRCCDVQIARGGSELVSRKP